MIVTLDSDQAPDTTNYVNIFLMQGDMPVEQGALVPRENILAHLRIRRTECRPIRDMKGRLKAWGIPRIEGRVHQAGFASWVRTVLPGGVLADAPLIDFGIQPQIVAVGMWVTFADIKARVPQIGIVRLETKQ